LKTNETLYVPPGYVSVVWFAQRLDPICGVAFSTNAGWLFGVTSTWTLARPTLSEARNSTYAEVLGGFSLIVTAPDTRGWQDKVPVYPGWNGETDTDWMVGFVKSPNGGFRRRIQNASQLKKYVIPCPIQSRLLNAAMLMPIIGRKKYRPKPTRIPAKNARAGCTEYRRNETTAPTTAQAIVATAARAEPISVRM